MIGRSLAVLTFLLASCPVAFGGLKPIVLDPSYNHDRWDTRPKDIIREFRAYTVSFDSDDDNNGDGQANAWGIPEWVAYEIRSFDGGCIDTRLRPDWFTDNDLRAAGIAPRNSSYTYSRAFRQRHPDWYVRGHMQMKFLAARLGPDAEWNTHTLLNAVPQRQQFNAGIWQELEALTGAWAQRFGAVWVITGPVVIDQFPSGYIGEEGEFPVAIPDALFKIVVKESNGPAQLDVLAFLYPQVGADYGHGIPYAHQNYLVTVDQLEELTGLDFFSVLTSEAQAGIEGTRPQWLWPVDDTDFLFSCRD